MYNNKIKSGTFFRAIKIKAEDSLSCYAQLVLYTLCKHTDNENFECYPSIPTLSKTCNISERSVMRATKELVEKGYIEKRKRYNNSVVYKICFELETNDNEGEKNALGLTRNAYTRQIGNQKQQMLKYVEAV